MLRVRHKVGILRHSLSISRSFIENLKPSFKPIKKQKINRISKKEGIGNHLVSDFCLAWRFSTVSLGSNGFMETEGFHSFLLFWIEALFWVFWFDGF
jgi:hypothetical protein